MRVVFMGSPDFAVASLRALLTMDLQVVGVVTQPDKPAGRGNELTAPAVKIFALSHGLDVHQPVKVRDGALAQWLRDRQADVAVVAAYGRILTTEVLQAPRLGCVNVHASLLPKWRGASPIARAIAAGDAQSGVCLMQMEQGLDTGPVLARAIVAIEENDTTATLQLKLAESGGQLLRNFLPKLAELHAVPQDEARASFAPPLQKSEGEIDWTWPAQRVSAHIRAMTPWPGAWTLLQGEVLKVFAEDLQRLDARGLPGEVLQIKSNSLIVACGAGALEIAQMQRPNKRRMTAAEVMRGVRLGTGMRFGA